MKEQPSPEQVGFHGLPKDLIDWLDDPLAKKIAEPQPPDLLLPPPRQLAAALKGAACPPKAKPVAR